MTQLDRIEKRQERIEQMLNRLLQIQGATVASTEVDDMRNVLATGGTKALKSYLRNQGAQK